MTSAQEIRDFLISRREKLQPEEVGLPRGTRRRDLSGAAARRRGAHAPVRPRPRSLRHSTRPPYTCASPGHAAAPARRHDRDPRRRRDRHARHRRRECPGPDPLPAGPRVAEDAQQGALRLSRSRCHALLRRLGRHRRRRGCHAAHGIGSCTRQRRRDPGRGAAQRQRGVRAALARATSSTTAVAPRSCTTPRSASFACATRLSRSSPCQASD